MSYNNSMITFYFYAKMHGMFHIPKTVPDYKPAPYIRNEQGVMKCK